MAYNVVILKSMTDYPTLVHEAAHSRHTDLEEMRHRFTSFWIENLHVERCNGEQASSRSYMQRAALPNEHAGRDYLLDGEVEYDYGYRRRNVEMKVEGCRLSIPRDDEDIEEASVILSRYREMLPGALANHVPYIAIDPEMAFCGLHYADTLRGHISPDYKRVTEQVAHCTEYYEMMLQGVVGRDEIATHFLHDLAKRRLEALVRFKFLDERHLALLEK